MRGDIDRFFEANRERWSESTETLYRYYLVRMSTYLGRWDATTEELRAWLDQTGWGASSRYQAILAARHFFRWLVGEPSSPAKSLRLPRRPMLLQKTLNEADIGRLVSACDTASPKGLRDVAMILLLLDSGLRGGEIVKLDVDHVRVEDRQLQAVTKGSRLQTKLFGAYTASQIAEWLVARKSVARANVSRLFVGVGGLHPGGPMTRDGLRANLYKLGVRAGIGPVTPHSLRRSFATIALKAGASTRELQLLGGWSDVRLVERYTLALQVSPEEFEAHSPVNRVMGLGSSVRGYHDR